MVSRTAVYGLSIYGEQTYGYFVPPIYRVDPFTAIPGDYESVTISWNKPSGTILGFRLVKNMYGVPVDQDDGQVLLDITSGYPGSIFTDTSPTPGAYHYYGFYCLINSETDEWVRSGVCGCLMPSDYGSAQYIMDLIPNFYVNSILGQNELALDPVGNTFLSQFIEVCGWGFDYLRTQYDTYLNVNDPWAVPLNDLYNMGAQFNLNINPDIHPYTLRKAIYYNATVNQLRGTASGIATELSALTGWNADITVGPNILLDNDQSYFLDPVFEPWSANITYNLGENVQYGSYWYACISTANYGNAPTGTSSSNTWWSAVLNTVNTSYLYNSRTNNISTWETLYPLLSNGTYSYTPSLTLVQSVQGTNLSGGSMSFGTATIAGNTIAVTVLATGGYTLSSITFNGAAMNLVGTYNDTASGGTDYYYTYALEGYTGSGTTVAVTKSGATGHIYGYAYEIANLGTTTTAWSAVGGESSSFDMGINATVPAFCTMGLMDASIPSGTTGSAWTTANAGTLGIGGYLLGGSPAYAGNLSSTDFYVCGMTAFNGTAFSALPTNYELLGVPDPVDPAYFAFNALGAENYYGSSTDLALRSISRTTTDIETVTTNFAPDKYQAMADGIPLPYLGFNDAWNASTVYPPQHVVTYNNQPFIALRESLNSVPPYSAIGEASQDWAPLSYEDRVRICISAYENASSAVTVTPFVEWYDAGGNYIMRLLARNSESGTVSVPSGICFDSFTVGVGSTLSARTTNDSGNSWNQATGSFSVSPFAGGCAYPTTSGSRSIATVSTGQANCQVGITFDSEPQSGQSAGLVFRYSDASNYFRADMTTLKVRESGALSTLGTYSTPFSVGDRMMVQLNGSTITVLRNNAQVLQVTNSFNSTVANYGIINENS